MDRIMRCMILFIFIRVILLSDYSGSKGIQLSRSVPFEIPSLLAPVTIPTDSRALLGKIRVGFDLPSVVHRNLKYTSFIFYREFYSQSPRIRKSSSQWGR
jgi:hypothetical protein